MSEKLLTNNIICRNISSQFIDNESEDIEKARVKSHTRKTKSGKLSQVKEYEDSRKKKIDLPKKGDSFNHPEFGELKFSHFIPESPSNKNKGDLYFENKYGHKKKLSQSEFEKINKKEEIHYKLGTNFTNNSKDQKDKFEKMIKVMSKKDDKIKSAYFNGINSKFSFTLKNEKDGTETFWSARNTMNGMDSKFIVVKEVYDSNNKVIESERKVVDPVVPKDGEFIANVGVSKSDSMTSSTMQQFYNIAKNM